MAACLGRKIQTDCATITLAATAVASFSQREALAVLTGAAGIVGIAGEAAGVAGAMRATASPGEYRQS